MYRTESDGVEAARDEVVRMCNARLAEAIDLQLQCKYVRWNIKGPDVLALRQLVGRVSDDVDVYVDLIAERAVELGGIADWTARVVETWEHLSEYHAGTAGERDYVRTLASALASFGHSTHGAIDRSAVLGDSVSAELFTAIASGIANWLRTVEAQLPAER